MDLPLWLSAMSERDFYSIGQFSKITGLSVKTLRFYHEQGLLVPRFVDDQTGYRYYDDRNVEAARIIAGLRGLDFPVAAIGEILKSVPTTPTCWNRLNGRRGRSKRGFGTIARLPSPWTKSSPTNERPDEPCNKDSTCKKRWRTTCSLPACE